MVGDILQPTHLLFVLIVALLVLGPKRLPEVGRQLGNGLRDFKSAINGESDPRQGEIGRDHNTSYETSAEDHEFAHEDPDEPEATVTEPAREHAVAAPADHEFAGAEPVSTASTHEPSDTAPDEKHEFAYESSDPAQARDQTPS